MNTYFYVSKILAPFLNLSNLILFFFLFFFYIYIIFKNKKLKLLSIIFSIIFLLISIFPFGYIGLKYLEKDFHNQQPLINPNYIVVLGGSESIKRTQETKKLNLNNNSERLIASVELALKYKNARIIFLGGDGNLSKEHISESDVAETFYKNVGFDLSRVKFYSTSRNTIENLNDFKNLELNDKNNVLITSAFHMKRAICISKKIGLDFIPYSVDHRTVISGQKLLNSYQNFSVTNNLNNINVFFREILGLLVATIVL